MRCKSFRRTLSLFRKGELPADQHESMEAHARSCGGCRALLEEDVFLDSLLAEASASDLPNAPEDLEQALRYRWRERQALSEIPNVARKPALRPLFAASLALNALAAAVLALALIGGSPQSARPPVVSEENGFQPGMLTPQEMRTVFREMEDFFGPRLDWVAASNGDISLGVLNGPEAGTLEPDSPVVLTFALESRTGGNAGERRVRSSVILARPSSRDRELILGEEGHSVEIHLSDLRMRGGRYQAEMNVRPLETAQPGETACSALSSRVILSPGEKSKLGQIHMGAQFWDLFLSVRLLDPNGGSHHG